MAGYDWRNLERTDIIRALMVSPTNVNDVLGELDGVDLSSSSLDCGYYSDTRTSGTLRVIGEHWIRGSLIRIIHEVPEWGYSNALGTYIVTNDHATRQRGTWGYDLTLQSRMFGLSTDKLVRPWVVSANAYTLTAMAQIANAAGYDITLTSANNYRLKNTQVIESGTARLSALFSLANLADNRLDVDGMGGLFAVPRMELSAKVPKFQLSVTDAKGVVQDGIGRSTDWLQMPDVAAVSFKYNDTSSGGSKSQNEINASAQVSQLAHQSHAQRGYTVTDFIELSDMTPQTAVRAQQVAEEYLARDAMEHIEWDVSTTYLPIWEGDAVQLIIPDGLAEYQGARTCLVKNVSLNLRTMTMQLTLRETASGEDE